MHRVSIHYYLEERIRYLGLDNTWIYLYKYDINNIKGAVP